MGPVMAVRRPHWTGETIGGHQGVDEDDNETGRARRRACNRGLKTPGEVLSNRQPLQGSINQAHVWLVVVFFH